MADFVALWDNRQSTIKKYFALLRETEANRATEIKAATDIQRVFRGYRTRQLLNYLHYCATQIRRIWLGYRARCYFVALKAKAARESKSHLFHYMASIIQKRWRGYHSRKYHQNFYARKKWIMAVIGKAEEVRKQVQLQYEHQCKQHAEKEEEEVAEAFERVTESLHHLISTKATPGVFASPFGPQFQATAFQIPIEDHIKQQFKNFQTKKQLSATRPPADPSATTAAPKRLPSLSTATPASSIPPDNTTRNNLSRAPSSDTKYGAPKGSSPGKTPVIPNAVKKNPKQRKIVG
eukprot:TRINITY_DN6799_c0_g1_i3.p1 TRINITY_DN6799_c0_g1~~TRINITY_DN6799_c0_g1_i3.p1  ORF type:complete len:293 (+),score=57.43 TRINITY_DN6799_c0_g1_i3:95-973(+)